MSVRYLLYAGVLLLVAWLLTGVTQVRPGERAVVRRFGRVLAEKPRPGLWVGLPWGMDRVDRVPVDLLRRVRVGYDPQAETREGAVPEGQLLTGDRNLVNVQVVLDYSVNEDEVEKYVVQEDRVDGLVTRAVESALAEWVAGRSVDDVLLNGKAALPRFLREAAQERLADYGLGVRVQDASVSVLEPPEEVKKEFAQVNEAQAKILTSKYQAEQDRSQLLGQAETEGNRLVREAEADAAEQRQLARTDAANFLKRLRQYRRFKATNPDYLHDLWFNEMKKVYARMRENGGRVEPLDKLLGRDGMDMIQVPIPERKK